MEKNNYKDGNYIKLIIGDSREKFKEIGDKVQLGHYKFSHFQKNGDQNIIYYQKLTK